jgi:hypothetical protein
VKRLLAEVLARQVQQAWLGREDALWVARQWLYEAPAARYAEAHAGDGAGLGRG